MVVGLKRVGGRFRLWKVVGAGSFGEVYEGLDILSKTRVAIKVETSRKHSSLEREIAIYKDIVGTPGIPRVFWFGSEDAYDVLVLELLGPSLEAKFADCSRTFPMKTVSMFADQMIRHVEALHSRGYIHRDIKPSNFLLGPEEDSAHVFLIDLGLAQRYIDPDTHQHIPYRHLDELVGTLRWASINAHAGVEQSRRDDLESLSYVLIYFARGFLPWQKLKGEEHIMAAKQSNAPETLCHGLPPVFAAFLSHARSLKFDETPDYGRIRRMFGALLDEEKAEKPSMLDTAIPCSEDGFPKPPFPLPRTPRRLASPSPGSSRVLRSQLRRSAAQTPG